MSKHNGKTAEEWYTLYAQEITKEPSYAWLHRYYIAAEDFLGVVSGAQDVFDTHIKDCQLVGGGQWRITSIIQAAERIDVASKVFFESLAKESTDWIEWHGGECPVDGDALVQVQVRCESEPDGRQSPRKASLWKWHHDDDIDDIIAYRVVHDGGPMPGEGWVVEIEDGCWLAPWSGDPGRTCVLEYAKRFTTQSEASIALEEARTYRHLKHAKVYRPVANQLAEGSGDE